MDRIIDSKVIQIGDSLGVTIPKETVDALNIKKGDSIKVTIEINKRD